MDVLGELYLLIIRLCFQMVGDKEDTKDWNLKQCGRDVFDFCQTGQY